MPNNKQKQMTKKLHSYPLGHESEHEGRREISGIGDAMQEEAL